MKCERCEVDMIEGQVIDPHYTDEVCTGFGGGPTTLNDETLDIINCWKCPECGHSDYINFL